MHKPRLGVRTMALATAFVLVAGTALQAQEEGGRQRGQRGGGERGQRGGGERGQRGGFGQRGGGFGQRGGGFSFGGQRGGGSRTMSKAQLLGIEEVQKELKIAGDQLETVSAALDAYNQERRGFRSQGGGFDREAFSRIRELEGEEREKAIAEMRKKAEEAQKEVDKKTAKLNKDTDEILAVLLEGAQWKRLGELQVQTTLRGGLMTALLDKEFAAKLKVTKDQTAKLEGLKKEQDKAREEMMTKMRDAFRNGGGGGGFDRSAFDEMRKKQEEAGKAREAKVTALLTDGQKEQLASMQGKKFTFPERRRGGFGQRGGRGGEQGGRGGRPQRPGGGGGSGRPARPGGGGGGGN